MKKWVSLLLSLLVLFGATALAEDAATALPLGATFAMDYDTVLALLGEGVEEDKWDEGEGNLMLLETPIGIGDIVADEISFQVDHNNSEGASRLSLIDLTLPVGDNCIAAFKAALATMTEAYGQPDGDPFDAAAVESYVEFGGLSATWTKTDVRINLSMSRMFGDYLTMDFSNRLCYNADDLK